MVNVDAWGGLFVDWELTWTYVDPLQPVTSAGGTQGAGGRSDQQALARGRFFSYPNIIDDGNLPRLPVTPKVAPRPVKKKGPSVETIDENDPTIQSMRLAMERRLHADEPSPRGDDELKRIYSWIQKRKQ